MTNAINIDPSDVTQEMLDAAMDEKHRERVEFAEDLVKQQDQEYAKIDRAYKQVREELFDETGSLTDGQLLEDKYFVWKLADLNSAKEALEDFFGNDMLGLYALENDGFTFEQNLDESGVKLSALMKEVAWGDKVMPVWNSKYGVRWQEEFDRAMEEALCAIPEYMDWALPKQKELDEHPHYLGSTASAPNGVYRRVVVK